jgi:hypothetical protein
MKTMIRSILFVSMCCALLTACAQPPPPVQALPPGPTPAEVTDYATAQAQYRAAQTSGNGRRSHACREYVLGHLPRDPLPARPWAG